MTWRKHPGAPQGFSSTFVKRHLTSPWGSPITCLLLRGGEDSFLCPHGALPCLFSQSKMRRHPFPLQLKPARAARALHTRARLLVTIHPFGVPSHFSHSGFLASSVSYCFNLIRLLPTYCLQHRNYSYLYVFLHSLCSAVLPDFFFIISFPNSLSFLS